MNRYDETKLRPVTSEPESYYDSPLLSPSSFLVLNQETEPFPGSFNPFPGLAGNDPKDSGQIWVRANKSYCNSNYTVNGTPGPTNESDNNSSPLSPSSFLTINQNVESSPESFSPFPVVADNDIWTRMSASLQTINQSFYNNNYAEDQIQMSNGTSRKHVQSQNKNDYKALVQQAITILITLEKGLSQSKPTWKPLEEEKEIKEQVEECEKFKKMKQKVKELIDSKENLKACRDTILRELDSQRYDQFLPLFEMLPQVTKYANLCDLRKFRKRFKEEGNGAMKFFRSATNEEDKLFLSILTFTTVLMFIPKDQDELNLFPLKEATTPYMLWLLSRPNMEIKNFDRLRESKTRTYLFGEFSRCFQSLKSEYEEIRKNKLQRFDDEEKRQSLEALESLEKLENLDLKEKLEQLRMLKGHLQDNRKNLQKERLAFKDKWHCLQEIISIGQRFISKDGTKNIGQINPEKNPDPRNQSLKRSRYQNECSLSKEEENFFDEISKSQKKIHADSL